MVMQRVRRKASRARWLMRYWMLDKYHEQLRLGAMGAALLIVVLVLLSLHSGYVERLVAPPERPVTQAFVWWVQLLVLVVAAIVSYALTPKPKAPEPQKPESPVTKDGKSMRRIYGTVWTTDPAMLAWKNGALEPIRKKGGKK